MAQVEDRYEAALKDAREALELRRAASDEQAAAAARRERGAVVAAHAARAALDETGSRLSRLASRVHELLSLEEDADDTPEAVPPASWSVDAAALDGRRHEGAAAGLAWADALADARHRAVTEAARAADAVARPAAARLKDFVCRSLPARRRAEQLAPFTPPPPARRPSVPRGGEREEGGGLTTPTVEDRSGDLARRLEDALRDQSDCSELRAKLALKDEEARGADLALREATDRAERADRDVAEVL